MYMNELIAKRWISTITLCQCRSYRTANPGIGKRLKIIREDNPDLSKVKQNEDLYDREVDISKAGQLHKDYQKRFERVSKQIKLKQIERLYFKTTKNPNLLLWSEKEQIRELHHSQPGKWTLEKLADSFPATEEIIQKIVKAQWKPKNQDAIRKHDEHVVANWKAVKEKKLDVAPQLASHIKKFSMRDRLVPQKQCTDLANLEEGDQDEKPSQTKHTAFVDLIRNHKNRNVPEPKSSSENNLQEFELSRPSETYVLGGSSNRQKNTKLWTLDELRDTGSISPTSKGPTNTDVTSPENHVQTGIINPSIDTFFALRRTNNEVTNVQKDTPPEEIPMNITIPKEKWKKGAVYRVNNCFYADDGEFLYKIF